VKKASAQTARLLRKVATPEERKLWQQLRNQKMGGLKFRRQHPCGSYVLDFYCIEKQVNIELDGKQHTDPEQRKQDEVRDEFLASQGITTIRIWNRAIRENLEDVLEQIATQLGLKT
jgi:very-short-patch-repair endonuclease